MFLYIFHWNLKRTFILEGNTQKTELKFKNFFLIPKKNVDQKIFWCYARKLKNYTEVKDYINR